MRNCRAPRSLPASFNHSGTRSFKALSCHQKMQMAGLVVAGSQATQTLGKLGMILGRIRDAIDPEIPVHRIAGKQDNAARQTQQVFPFGQLECTLQRIAVESRQATGFLTGERAAQE